MRSHNPRTLLGKGQVEQLSALVAHEAADVVVIDSSLTPVQQKNLEIAFDAKVVDRTGLILEIFGERAATAEGRLQVELAHLEYQAGRLVRSWTHLERQRGGYGFLGGPGETQIETDRRLLRNRITQIRKDLEAVRRTRTLHRSHRKKLQYPTIALVGYTNAGKSTLFNRLTDSSVFSKDLLFATLDPVMRETWIPDYGKAIVSDTVGFVSDLPTELVAAFRATLEEVVEADLIVHVRDISHPDTESQKADVVDILSSLGVIEGSGRVPIVEAWNKFDLIPAEEKVPLTKRASAHMPPAATVSATTGEGMDAFLTLVRHLLSGPVEHHHIAVHPSDTRRLSWLYANGTVISQTERQGMLELEVELSQDRLRTFRRL